MVEIPGIQPIYDSKIMIHFKTKTAKQFVARRLVRIIRFTRISFNNFSIDGIRKISYTTQDARYTTNPIACSGKFLWFLIDNFLRGVHTQALSFLKINVGKKRVRQRTTSIDFESIQFQSRFMSDPPLSDIDSKNKMFLV